MENDIREMVRKAFRDILTGDFTVPEAAIEEAVRETRSSGAPVIGQDGLAYNPSAGVRRVIARALEKAYRK